MLGLNRLSIKSRLLLVLLLVSISSILVVGLLAYRSAQTIIQERIFSQLTSVRTSRAYQMETYLRSLQNHVATLSEDFAVVSAVGQLKGAFRRLEDSSLSPEQSAELTAFYESEFLPRLAANSEGQPVLRTYLPERPQPLYLQYHYIANNPNPTGEKSKLEFAFDGSTYSTIHERYHQTFINLTEAFGYYDLFLIDAETGDVLYSVTKEVDFGTNLYTGVYSSSGLAQSVQAAANEQNQGAVSMVDFSFYKPSYNAPAAFAAAPIFDTNGLSGILAVQFPVDEINRIMTGGGNWSANGLGQSGETYLVGSDKHMRSASRFLLEDKPDYLGTLEAAGVSEQTRNMIDTFSTSILLQEVDTEAVSEALGGHADTRIISDYRGVDVLSSFAPLQIANLDWTILSEMDLSEAYAPLYAFERRLILWTVGLVLLITAFAMLIANLFTKPIDAFIEGAKAIASGEAEAISVRSKDEFGQLATSLNGMVDNLRAQTQVQREQNQRSEALLFNILPARVARRLTEGETQIVDRYPNVSVLYANLLGFSKLTDTQSAEDTISMLNELVTLFDEAAEANGVEKVKTVGPNYMAVCGVAVPRLDHAKRSVAFAKDLKKKLLFFNSQRGTSLDLAIGVDSGQVVAGIVGLRNFIYDLWGEPVETAVELSSEAEADSIVVSSDIYDVLNDVFEFQTAQHSELGEVWTLAEPEPVRKTS